MKHQNTQQNNQAMQDLATLAQARQRLMDELGSNRRAIYDVVTDNMQACLDNGFINIDYACIMRRLSD